LSDGTLSIVTLCRQVVALLSDGTLSIVTLCRQVVALLSDGTCVKGLKFSVIVQLINRRVLVN